MSESQAAHSTISNSFLSYCHEYIFPGPHDHKQHSTTYSVTSHRLVCASHFHIALYSMSTLYTTVQYVNSIHHSTVCQLYNTMVQYVNSITPWCSMSTLYTTVQYVNSRHHGTVCTLYSMLTLYYTAQYMYVNCIHMSSYCRNK